MGKRIQRLWRLLLSLALLILFCFALSACGKDEAAAPPALGQLQEESGIGLYIDGEGPIPATLIARSNNHLSIEEDQQVFQELTQELDKLVEIAGQMDEAISNESMNTEGIVSGQDAGKEDGDAQGPAAR